MSNAAQDHGVEHAAIQRELLDGTNWGDDWSDVLGRVIRNAAGIISQLEGRIAALEAVSRDR